MARRPRLAAHNYCKGKGQPTLKAEEALRVLQEKMDAVRGLFHGFDYSGCRDTIGQRLGQRKT